MSGLTEGGRLAEKGRLTWAAAAGWLEEGDGVGSSGALVPDSAVAARALPAQSKLAAVVIAPQVGSGGEGILFSRLAAVTPGEASEGCGRAFAKNSGRNRTFIVVVYAKY